MRSLAKRAGAFQPTLSILRATISRFMRHASPPQPRIGPNRARRHTEPTIKRVSLKWAWTLQSRTCPHELANLLQFRSLRRTRAASQRPQDSSTLGKAPKVFESRRLFLSKLLVKRCLACLWKVKWRLGTCTRNSSEKF